MSSTAKTRLYLLLIAVLPPLLMIAVIYFYSIDRYEQIGGERANMSMSKFALLHDSYLSGLRNKAISLAKSQEMEKAVLLIRSGRADEINLDRQKFGFDIIELVDSTYRVIASSHRPGLIGEYLHKDIKADLANDGYLESVEYDMNGKSAAFGYFVPVGNNLRLYASMYITDDYLLLIAQILNADLSLVFDDTIDSKVKADYAQLIRGQLFKNDKNEKLISLLAGGSGAGYYLIAEFDIAGEKPLFLSLLKMTALVGLVSVILAILVGIYITGQTKKEIDNLIGATRQIATGDLTTPVMAYQEGEFSELADSLTDMKQKLKDNIEKLSTTEKVAAWKEMGQKIAHEVKNPLTPIAISIDDLRQSYYEKLPDFDKTIDETTTVIKTEISRLLKLLDQFVKFARMEPPVIKESSLDNLIGGIQSLYQREIEMNRLSVINSSATDKIKLDSEKIKQVLINLIKNGLESSDDASVKLSFSDSADSLVIRVEDNGPGFPDEMLSSHIKPYRSTKKGGSGLGLVISARIVFDHNGSMKIENSQEGGGMVQISLPR